MARTPSKNSFYVRNKDLLVEIHKYRKTCRYDENGKYVVGSGRATETLGRMIMKIANGLAQKPNYSGYTWVDDMKAEAMLTVIKYLKNFDPEKSQNPFAYITQICSNSFMGYINKQKRHSKIKTHLFDNKDRCADDSTDSYVGKAINYTEFKE